MTMEKEKLDEIIANHGRWLQGEGGKRADLRHADLSYAILCHADLEGADLEGANLEGADLEKANLEGANLSKADLRGAKLPIGVYQIVGAGSHNRCTTYITINDQVVCGCWNDGAGNHLDSFARRIEEVYGPKGENPDSIHYAEYMSAVAFFKAIKGVEIKP